MSQTKSIDRRQTQDRVEQIRRRLRGLMDEGKLATMLLGRVEPEHFVQICMTQLLKGGKSMIEADPITFVRACVEAAQLGLKPDSILGECYLIPRKVSYKNPDGSWAKNKKTVVNFQIGYHGLMKLIRRSDQIRDLSPQVVYANDEFEVLYGTDGRIIHRPYFVNGQTAPGEVVAAYNVATFIDGTKSFRVVPRHDLDKAASASGDPNDPNKWSDAWNKHYDAMVLKVALTRHAKWLPMPDDCRRAVQRDELREQGLPVEDGDDEYIDTDVVEPDEGAPPADLDDLIPKQ